MTTKTKIGNTKLPKNQKINQDEKVREVKVAINSSRLKIKEDKSKVDKLGEKTVSVKPEDIRIMYAAKMCLELNKQKVASGNMLKAYLRDYEGVITEDVKNELLSIEADFEKGFEKAKAKTTKIVETHPLWLKFSDIAGLSAYRFGIIMSMIRDIERFDTPSKLCVYAGVVDKNGVALRKGTISDFKDMYSLEGREFGGFNTHFAQQMYLLTESFVKSTGYFYNWMEQLRQRLEKQAINDGKCFLLTAELKKELKNKDGNSTIIDSAQAKVGEYYMVGKKNYSLKMWSFNNVRRRASRTFLHLLWAEWRKMAGLEVRLPYPIEYLGHKQYITLDEVISAEQEIKKQKSKAKELK